MHTHWLVASLSVGAAAAFALSSSLKHVSAGRVPDVQSLHPRRYRAFVVGTLTHRWWLGGIACDVVGVALQAIALHIGDLALVQPLLTLGLVFALLLRRFHDHHRISTRQIGYAGLLTLALAAFVTLVGSNGSAHHHDTDRAPAAIAAAVGVVAVIVCLQLGRRQSRRGRAAALMGAAVGVVYAGSAALLKAVTDLAAGGPLHVIASWQLYALVLTAVLGLFLNQVAFQAGPLTASLPSTATVDPVTSIALGVLIFDEHIHRGHGNGIALVALLGVFVFAAIQLGRSHVQEDEPDGRPPQDSPDADAGADSGDEAGDGASAGAVDPPVDEVSNTGDEPSRWSALMHSRRLRHVVIAIAVVLVLEYFAVPALVGASQNLDLLGRVNVGWTIVATCCEAASLVCYALLTRSLLLKSNRPSPVTLTGITLATTATAHVLPAGTAGAVGVGYHLLTARGVTGNEAAFAIATGSIGSAVVLNAMLLPVLLVSVPFAGLHPIFLVVALVAVAALVGGYLLVYLLTQGQHRALRIVRALGRRLPRVGADRLENAVRQFGRSVGRLAADRQLKRQVFVWAALNWLFDAASLWAFVAAFGHLLNPVELFAAYGIAYILAVIPITPSGLGVIEVTAASLLVSFGLPRATATLSVIGWRLLNFWLPIPLGALTYVSLALPRGSGLSARRHALAGLFTARRNTEIPAENSSAP